MGVFISYAREDALKAKAIVRALEEASFDVWFDERIPSGAEFSGEIEEALGNAFAVVVLWSRASVKSAWVRDEASEGRDTGRLVPILIDDCRPPMGFRQFQSVDLSRWAGRGRPEQIDTLIAAVRSKSGAVPKAGAVTAQGSPSQPGRRLTWTVGAAAALFAIAGGLYLERMRRPPSPSPPSVALLPFNADASDPDARSLAVAAHDSMVQKLTESQVALSVVNALPGDGKAPADFVISGQVSSTADTDQITVRMEDTALHVVVFSEQFEASRKDVADLPERIGAQVAVALRPLSQRASRLFLDELRNPSDPSIPAQLLRISISLKSKMGPLQSYEIYRRLAAKAPKSGIVQLGLALNTGFALGLIPRAERATAVAAARTASDRALAAAPDFGDVYIPWCLLHSEERMRECEDRLRVGKGADPESAFVNAYLSALLNDVGRNRESAELAGLSRANAQYVPSRISGMLRMQEATGEVSEAEQLYGQASRWWPANRMIESGRWLGIIQRGDFDAAKRFDDAIRKADPTLTDDSVSKLAAAVKAHSSTSLKQSCTKQSSVLDLCMLALARVGDLSAAFAIANELYPMRRGRNMAEQERIWIENPEGPPLALLSSPAGAPLRGDPRFLAITDRVGLLAYWRSGRLPDFCTVGREPICKAIARPA